MSTPTLRLIVGGTVVPPGPLVVPITADFLGASGRALGAIQCTVKYSKSRFAFTGLAHGPDLAGAYNATTPGVIIFNAFTTDGIRANQVLATITLQVKPSYGNTSITIAVDTLADVAGATWPAFAVTPLTVCVRSSA